MNKKTYINKKGFSLTEVLVATIVMSMIMGSVLGFVQYAGDIWHRGTEKVSSDNYAKMALEFIKQELLTATKIDDSNGIDETKPFLKYTKKNESTEVINNFTIRVPKKIKDNESSKDKSTLMRITNSEQPSYIRIAKNVNLFRVKRISKRTFEISIQISKEHSEDELDEYQGLSEDEKKDFILKSIIASESMVMIAPGIE